MTSHRTDIMIRCHICHCQYLLRPYPVPYPVPHCQYSCTISTQTLHITYSFELHSQGSIWSSALITVTHPAKETTICAANFSEIPAIRFAICTALHKHFEQNTKNVYVCVSVCSTFGENSQIIRFCLQASLKMKGVNMQPRSRHRHHLQWCLCISVCGCPQYLVTSIWNAVNHIFTLLIISTPAFLFQTF